MSQGSQSAGRVERRARSQLPRRPGIRLFVAAHPPAAALDYLVERLAELELPPHRITPRDQIHLTLHFIGDTPESELERVLESVERAAGGLRTTSIRLLRLIALPRRGPARLIAAETDAPATLRELHDRLVRRLAHTPRDSAGKGYLPHLTLCRFRTPSVYRVPDDLFRETQATPPPEFPLAELSVVKSSLRPAGAEHTIIARFELLGDK